jgi:hypothetical protein
MKKMFLLLFVLMMVTAAYASASGASVTIDLLNQNPDPARAGDIVKLRFQIQNIGDTAANSLEMRIVGDYPFTPVGTDASQTIQSLAPYQNGDNSANAAFTVKIDKDALKGTYKLKMQYSFNNGPWIETPYDIQVDNKEYARIESLSTAQIEPGKEADLNFTITNLGNAPLQNLVFSWQEPDSAILPVYSDDSRYIKFLDVGQSVTVSYKVIADVNVKAGLYKLNLDLKFESVDTATATEITSKAGVLVGGKTDFDVAFSESSVGQTSLSIANVGNNPALSVSVMIPQQPGYRVSGSSSAIIGNLDRGDYTIVSFPITSIARNATAGANAFPRQNRTTTRNMTTGSDLQVIIKYTDTTGERVSVEKSVQVQFRSGTTGTGTGGNFSGRTASSGFIGSIWFWVLIIAVVAVGSYFIWGRKEKHK